MESERARLPVAGVLPVFEAVWRAPRDGLEKDTVLVNPRRPLSESLAVHDRVYAAIRDALLTGRIEPGKGVSLRTLAVELGVSPMPVRDAVRRLVAEHALVINQANKRLSAPSLSAHRLEQLALARQWIEPELAARAAHRSDEVLIADLRRIDSELNAAIEQGDVHAYMAANHTFHFRLYEKADADVLLAMAGGLWLQIGPFMRIVFDRLGAVNLDHDHHVEVIQALATGDADAARAALAADIGEGMDAMWAAVNEDLGNTGAA